MLESIISSSTRIRILMRLFLNPESRAYLRELATEFSCSPSQIGYELKQLSSSQLVTKEKNGRNILYQANQGHPLFPELRSMVMKTLGMQRIMETVLDHLGELELALLVGDYAEGKDSGIIDLVLVGEIDREYLQQLVHSAEKHIKRKIRPLILSMEEYQHLHHGLAIRPQLVLWNKNILPAEGSRSLAFVGVEQRR